MGRLSFFLLEKKTLQNTKMRKTTTKTRNIKKTLGRSRKEKQHRLNRSE
jgi:hypothetical protein